LSRDAEYGIVSALPSPLKCLEVIIRESGEPLGTVGRNPPQIQKTAPSNAFRERGRPPRGQPFLPGFPHYPLSPCPQERGPFCSFQGPFGRGSLCHPLVPGPPHR